MYSHKQKINYFTKTLALACCAFVIVLFLSSSILGNFAWAETTSAINSDQDAKTSITSDEAAFGLDNVSRNQVGINKTYSQKYYGYVFPLGNTSSSHFAVLVTNKQIIVYISKDMANKASFSISSKTDKDKFWKMLYALDEDLSNGGIKLADLKLPKKFITEQTYTTGKTTYTFDKEIEEGFYYATCVIKGKTDCKQAAQFCLSGQILPVGEVSTSGEQTWAQKLASFLSPENMDYRPLWVSLKTAGVAMIFIFILGIIAAHRCMNVKTRWKGILDSVFTIPMVLPPTVCGFILLLLLGKSSAVGRFLIDHGIDLIFSWPAAVIAAIIVGFPLMYRTVLGAFENLDTNMLDAARTLGWSERKIFHKLMLPLAWPSIAAGIVLAFARAMGEFGATLFVAGNYPGVTQTMPLAIYFAWMGNSNDVAIFWVIVVILISFIIILIINIYSAHTQAYRKAGGKANKEDATSEVESAFTFNEEIAAELNFGSKKE